MVLWLVGRQNLGGSYVAGRIDFDMAFVDGVSENLPFYYFYSVGTGRGYSLKRLASSEQIPSKFFFTKKARSSRRSSKAKAKPTSGQMLLSQSFIFMKIRFPKVSFIHFLLAQKTNQKRAPIHLGLRPSLRFS